MASRSVHQQRRRFALALAIGAGLALSCDLSLDVDSEPTGPTPACYDYGALTGVVGTIDRDFTSDIEVVNGYAYLGGSSIMLADVRVAGAPVVIDEIPVWGYRMARVSTGICAMSGRGLTIVGVDPATRGKVLGEIRLPFNIQDLAASGRYAYVIDDRFGLWVIDAGDPTKLRIAGSVSIPEASFSLAARGSLVVVSAEAGLWVIDVTNPASPERVGFIKGEYADYDNALEIIDRFAVASAGPWISVIDLSNPSAPELVQRTNLGGPRVVDIAFDGTRAYLCGQDFVVVDLSRPTTPTVVSRISRVFARSVALVGDRALLGGDRQVLVMKLSRTRRPSPLARVDLSGIALHTALQPRLALVAGSLFGLWVIDLQSSPGVSGRLPISGGALDVVTDSTYAYVASHQALIVAEVETTLLPRLVSELSLPGDSWAIALEEGRVFLAQGRFGLWIVDVSDPLAPRILGSVDSPSEARDVAARDGWAWITDLHDGLLTVDARNPASPRIVASTEIDQATSLAVSDDHVYVVTNYGGLQVVDVSSPTKPELVGELAGLGRLVDVTVSGTLAYVAGETGVWAVDITDPESPMILGLADDEPTSGILADPETERLFLTNDDLRVIRVQCEDGSLRGMQ